MGICLALLNYYRPAKSVSEERAEITTTPAPVESAAPTSDIVAIQPLTVPLQSNSSEQVAAAVVANPQPDVLYRALQESSDPQEKRSLRKQLAALKPGEVPFRFAMAKYGNASNDQEKLHLQSIIAQIDVSDFVSEVANAASQTQDESLFVSLAYALRNSTNIPARQELLKLVANNQLPSVHTNAVMLNQGLVALHRCLLDSLQASDLAWIKVYTMTNPLNAAQSKIVADFIAKTK